MSAPGPVRAAVTTRSDWQTPRQLFDKLDAEFHFTLDAAADETNKMVRNFRSGPCIKASGVLCVCGLCAPWYEYSVWLNPPYGTELKQWVAKAFQEYETRTTVLLLPNNTDTEWFSGVWDWADEIRFLKGRVQFVGTTSSNTGGSCVAIRRDLKARNNRAPRPICSLWDWKQ